MSDAIPLSRRARRENSEPEESLSNFNWGDDFVKPQHEEPTDDSPTIKPSWQFEDPSDSPVSFEKSVSPSFNDYARNEPVNYDFEESSSTRNSPVTDSLHNNHDITTLDDNAGDINIDDLLEILLDKKGSDLHLSAKAYPTIRVNGEMEPLGSFPRLSGQQIKDAMYSIMTTLQRNKYEETWELDFAHTLPGKSRFRVNVMRQRGEVGAVLRVIPWEIKPIEALNLPEILNSFADLPRGLVLVTGPTGSGKSTTLAAIIDRANRTRAGHIMTVEDPIEFVHEHRKCIVNQREVGSDTESFTSALKHVLRQDPDIILIGELRDLETITIALTAAETGHLVFGTLHTSSAQETITRIVDVFPEGSKAMVRTQLAASVQAIVCQTLLKKIGGGRIAAVEILIGTDAIRNLIRDDKLHQIQSSLQTGAAFGMQTLDSVMEKLVREGTVTWEEASSKSTNRLEFIKNLGGDAGIARIERMVSGRAHGGMNL